MYDTIIVGAGQAGLTAGYYLKKLNQSFLILDRGQEIGQAWKERYDSLVLFTPRQYSSLPGLSLEGDLNKLPTKDEIASYLIRYAKTFQLSLKLNTLVTGIKKEEDYYITSTNGQHYQSKNVIIATGPFHKPNIPAFATNLSSNVFQLHSSEYKNPTQLKDGNILVVGAGNSGAQIAVELSKERETFLSTSQKLHFMPLTVGNRSIFWWFDKLGILKASESSLIGRKIQKRGDPIFGVELRSAIQKKRITIVGRTIEAIDNKISVKNHNPLSVQNIIWATGFKPDYQFLINIPGVINSEGYPIHKRGITTSKGLFFLGLPWQSRRGSALLQGVAFDARYVLNHLEK